MGNFVSTVSASNHSPLNKQTYFNRSLESIPCTWFRGGTSKGAVFLLEDLPESQKEREQVILNVMGSPDPTGREISGIGGGDSLSSKVVIVSKSKRPDADVDYLFCQVHIKEAVVETSLNCGNMLSVVAPFALEHGLVNANEKETTVRVYNENTNVVVEATVQTPNKQVTYIGDTFIDGVSESGAPIKLTFLDAVGAKTGKLLPTGNLIDDIDGIETTCVDVAVPMVIVNARDFGKRGYETVSELNDDKIFLSNLEKHRQKAALKMGLGDVTGKINPKICLVAPARDGGTITSRYFTPFDCHSSHAVSGGLCLASASLIKGSVANKVTGTTAELNKDNKVVIEHPCGKIETVILAENKINSEGKEEIYFPKASFIRTARPLMEGKALYQKRV